MSVLGRNVNVMDADGVILGTGSPARAGTVHEGALLAARQRRVVEVRDADTLHGVQPGVNLPLRSGGHVIGVVGVTGDPDEVRVLGDLIRVTAELMVDQATAAESQQWRLRERGELVAQAATGAIPPRAVADWAAPLGVDVEARRVAVVVVPDGPPESVEEEAGSLRALARDLAGVRGVLVGRVAPRELVAYAPAGSGSGLPAAVSELLEAHPEVRYAAGPAFGGPTAFARGYQAARATLTVASAMGAGGRRHHFDDEPLAVLVSALAGDWRGDLLAEPWQRLAAADRNGELTETFRAYVRHQASTTATAAALHVHRNTVRYRLGRIGEITGLDMDRLVDVVWLHLGAAVTR